MGKLCKKNNSGIAIIMNIINQHKLNQIKYLIWAYFVLLVFEGALRKWIVPSLSTPLLIIRDPVAILLMFKATQLGVGWMNNYIRIAWFVTAVSFALSFLIGHQNIMVAVFGLRIMLIHFPLIFIIGKVFNKKDVLQMGQVLLLFSIIMTILIALQYFSPQSSWVNRGVGGDAEGSGFSGANGYLRPSGVFSFTNGVVLFYQICLVYILYFWMNGFLGKKIILYASTVAYLLAMVLCISRTLVASSVLTMLFLFIYGLKSPKHTYKMLQMLVVLFVVILLLQLTPIFNIATETLLQRFESASNSEGDFVQGSIGKRIFGGVFDAFSNSMNSPFFEGRLGMGTSVGSKLLTGGQAYLLSEGEIGRVLGERGFILGLILLGTRFFFAYSLGIKSFILTKKNELLPWLFYSALGVNIFIGLWGQPTALGFIVLPAGLSLACFNSIKIKKT
jgi:hypothetical protein